ncbi:MAG TPA: HupE/UreJ family protein [Polyangiaceae bacterium]|nr:HupE/UreJ family protein [Polyangiaceae bacterium]
MDQLLLMPDREHGVLRGQVTFNPHRTRENEDESPAEIERRVLATLSANIKIELDGKPCRARYQVRELWVAPAATVGDIVMVRCELPRNARELRVFADGSIPSLVVTVESSDASGAVTSRSVMVPGGSFSPPYRFHAASDWRSGGANQFLPDGGLASSEPTASAGALEPATPAPSSAALAPTPAPANAGDFVEAAPLAEAKRYLVLGFHHILPLGWDHVLFVAGLVLGSGLRLRALVLQLSAFTLAHTLTLALGALGWIVLPARLVEPLIAFSIAYVALENLRPSGALRYRLLIVLGFGLLHGQGFASALVQTGLPRDSFLVALLSFNVGVELGQLTVVLALVCLLRLSLKPEKMRRFAIVPGSIAIALAGLYWGIQRLLG